MNAAKFSKRRANQKSNTNRDKIRRISLFKMCIPRVNIRNHFENH